MSVCSGAQALLRGSHRQTEAVAVATTPPTTTTGASAHVCAADVATTAADVAVAAAIEADKALLRGRSTPEYSEAELLRGRDAQENCGGCGQAGGTREFGEAQAG